MNRRNKTIGISDLIMELCLMWKIWLAFSAIGVFCGLIGGLINFNHQDAAIQNVSELSQEEQRAVDYVKELQKRIDIESEKYQELHSITVQQEEYTVLLMQYSIEIDDEMNAWNIEQAKTLAQVYVNEMQRGELQRNIVKKSDIPEAYLNDSFYVQQEGGTIFSLEIYLTDDMDIDVVEQEINDYIKDITEKYSDAVVEHRLNCVTSKFNRSCNTMVEETEEQILGAVQSLEQELEQLKKEFNDVQNSALVNSEGNTVDDEMHVVETQSNPKNKIIIIKGIVEGIVFGSILGIVLCIVMIFMRRRLSFFDSGENIKDIRIMGVICNLEKYNWLARKIIALKIGTTNVEEQMSLISNNIQLACHKDNKQIVKIMCIDTLINENAIKTLCDTLNKNGIEVSALEASNCESFREINCTDLVVLYGTERNTTYAKLDNVIDVLEYLDMEVAGIVIGQNNN